MTQLGIALVILGAAAIVTGLSALGAVIIGGLLVIAGATTALGQGRRNLTIVWLAALDFATFLLDLGARFYADWTVSSSLLAGEAAGRDLASFDDFTIALRIARLLLALATAVFAIARLKKKKGPDFSEPSSLSNQ